MTSRNVRSSFSAVYSRLERLKVLLCPEVSYERVSASKTHIARARTHKRWNRMLPRTRDELSVRALKNIRKIRALSTVSDVVLLPTVMITFAMIMTLVVMKFISITSTRDVIVAILALATLMVAVRAWSLSRAMCAHIERQSSILARLRIKDEN